MIVLVLAGGSDQIALIKELKDRGHKVVLVDYFENPPAKPFADKHIVASTLDKEAITVIAKKENVELVVTACTDQALLTVAKVSENLSLPCYISYQTALNVTNKSYMKRIMIENDIPTAKYVLLKDVVVDSFADFKFPMVVKPVDCNSSKGVKKMETLGTVSKYLQEAINHSRTKEAIIEEFIEGEELSVDMYVENTTAKLLSITNSNKIKNENAFTITQSYYSLLNNYDEIKIVSIAQKIVNAFELKDTPLLIQMVKNKDEYFILEFSARMGGGSKYKLIEVLSGVNIMSVYVDRILGKFPKVSPEKIVNFATMNYVYCKNGQITEFYGFDTLKENKIIEAYFYYKTVGMEILQSMYSGDRAAGYLIIANTEKELSDRSNIAKNTIKVLGTKNTNLVKHQWL